MPRKRKYRNNAEKQAEYRRRTRTIIAVDGEGYTAYNSHTYASFFAYNGEKLYEVNAVDYGLTLGKILRFIRDVALENQDAIWISFSFSYDVTMIFRELSADEIQRMLTTGVYLTDYGVYVQYRYRKQLRIVYNQKLSVVIYDIFGFTSTSFLETMRIFGVDADRDIIAEGKRLRGDFDEYTLDRIRSYTRAELAALIQVFERILHYAKNAELSLTRYEGAGSVASALFRRYGYNGKTAAKMAVKSTSDNDEIIKDRLLRAYFGGRIETLKYGYVKNVLGYDIVSAYPSVTVNLPSLEHNVFLYAEKPDKSFITHLLETHDYGVITLRYDLPENYFYPFPYRSGSSVYFPQKGYSTVYLPLFKTALRFIPRLWDYVEITDIIWLDNGHMCEKPFNWIVEVFERRRKLKQEGNGAQIMLKLGLNSLYGKFAQKPIVLSEDKVIKGTYENIFYAGYITATTQSKLLEAAYQRPEAVIAMATDGIYTTRELDLPLGAGLGLWEKEQWEEGIFVYSGFYILKSEGKLKYRTRGLHVKRIEELFRDIRVKWESGHKETSVAMTVFHSIKKKKKDDDLVGYFEEIEKIIDLTGGKGKRTSIYNGKPHMELCETIPVGYDYFDNLSDKARSHTIDYDIDESED